MTFIMVDRTRQQDIDSSSLKDRVKAGGILIGVIGGVFLGTLFPTMLMEELCNISPSTEAFRWLRPSIQFGLFILLVVLAKMAFTWPRLLVLVLTIFFSLALVLTFDAYGLTNMNMTQAEVNGLCHK